MRKWIRLIIGFYAAALFVYGSWQIITYYREALASKAVNDEWISRAVVEQTDSETAVVSEALEQAPITVDFNYLKEQSDDIVAWLYMEDSTINYPVAQASDNQYYLNHLPDGTRNRSGTLFADYRNSGTFTDLNTVIYGHNMKNDTAFGTLELYKEPEYYEEHSVMWLLTPNKTCKLELIAGYVTSSDSPIYLQDLTWGRQMEVVTEAMQKSTFDSGAELQPEDRFVSLSTCSYEYSDARYVLIGRMIEID